VRLWPRKTVEYVQSQPLFDRVVRAAFSQRRKTLRNSLRGLVRPETFVDAGIDGGLRPEVLAIADFARLANLIASSAEQTANVSDKGGTKPMI
jgi:16S rRNA (adenine1518-N6/adenine1519-N6)-dimethyltransferase